MGRADNLGKPKGIWIEELDCNMDGTSRESGTGNGWKENERLIVVWIGKIGWEGIVESFYRNQYMAL